jgi:hypothetical protein
VMIEAVRGLVEGRVLGRGHENDFRGCDGACKGCESENGAVRVIVEAMRVLVEARVLVKTL